MRRHFHFPASLLLLLLPLLFLSSCSNGDWRVYEGSEFTIEFPGPPHDTVTSTGNLAGVKVYYEPAEGSLDSNVYYSLSMYSLPDSISVLGNKLDNYLETDVKIYAWTIGGELTDTGRVVKSGPVSGREYRVTLANNEGIATVRKFPMGKHLYTLLVVTENMKLNNHEIEHFMNSFKLKTPGGKKS